MSPTANPHVTIVAFGTFDEATALRALLESMAYEVRLLKVTTPADAPKALQRASEDTIVILSAQGGPRGFYLGPVGGRVDTSAMNGNWLPVNVAFDGIRFRDSSVLISTACATRDSGLIDAIVKSGGRLIAPLGYPDGQVIVPWIGACLLGVERGLSEAVIAANALVGYEDQFSYG